MIPVVEGRLPLVVAVDRAGDIETALDLARELNLKIMILGGAEAWKVSSRLAAAKVAGAHRRARQHPVELRDLGSRQENAGLLAKAGVPLVILGSAGRGVQRAEHQAGGRQAPWPTEWAGTRRCGP